MDGPSYKYSYPHNIHPVPIKKVKTSIKYREITVIYSQNHTNTPVGKMQRFSKLNKKIMIPETEGFHIRSQQSD
jgi:hypothetical protein